MLGKADQMCFVPVMWNSYLMNYNKAMHDQVAPGPNASAEAKKRAGDVKRFKRSLDWQAHCHPEAILQTNVLAVRTYLRYVSGNLKAVIVPKMKWDGNFRHLVALVILVTCKWD